MIIVHSGFNTNINLPFECRQAKLQNTVLVFKKQWFNSEDHLYNILNP